MGKTEQVKRLAEYEWGKKNILLFHHGQRRLPPLGLKPIVGTCWSAVGGSNQPITMLDTKTTAVGLY